MNIIGFTYYLLIIQFYEGCNCVELTQGKRVN